MFQSFSDIWRYMFLILFPNSKSSGCLKIGSQCGNIFINEYCMLCFVWLRWLMLKQLSSWAVNDFVIKWIGHLIKKKKEKLSSLLWLGHQKVFVGKLSSSSGNGKFQNSQFLLRSQILSQSPNNLSCFLLEVTASFHSFKVKQVPNIHIY